MSGLPRQVRFPVHDATVPALLRWAVERSGDALLAVRGEQRITYRELDERSAALAKGLVASGVGKGSRVGLLAPNGPDWIVSFFAAARVGAVVCLLNTYHQPRELRWVLGHADVQHLLTCRDHLGHDYAARLEDVAPELRVANDTCLYLPSLPGLRSVWMSGGSDRAWASDPESLVVAGAEVPDAVLSGLEDAVTPADPLVVVYSSGSTAEPKGAVHGHGGVVRHAHNLWQFRELGPDDVIYTPMPLFWIGGLSFVLMAAIHSGAALVFEDRFVPADTLGVLERERVTQVIGWPHVIKALVEEPSYGDRSLALKGWGPTGPLNVDPAERANSLGMTETLGPHTIEDGRVPLVPGKTGSFGRSVPGVEHRVVDPVTAAPLGVGELGELWVRGYSLMLGLHRRERDDVFEPDGWYRTGDMGLFDADGHFYFKGRAGDQIKSSGMNVTPREVELVLEDLDEVGMALVLGVPHADRGEDVCAVVVAVPGAAPDPEALRAAVKAQLSAYKVPRHVVVLESQQELPWLDSGKVDRRGLAQRVRAMIVGEIEHE